MANYKGRTGRDVLDARMPDTRCRQEELGLVREAAAALGMKPSCFVRDTLVQRAKFVLRQESATGTDGPRRLPES